MHCLGCSNWDAEDAALAGTGPESIHVCPGCGHEERIVDLEAKLAEAQFEIDRPGGFAWWREHGQRLRNAIAEHIALEAISDRELEDAPAEIARRLAEARAELAIMREEHIIWEKHGLVQIVQERDALQPALAQTREASQRLSKSVRTFLEFCDDLDQTWDAGPCLDEVKKHLAALDTGKEEQD